MPRYYDDSDEDLYENPYAESDTDADDDDVDEVDDVYENPASVVRTARDERLWRMAKASAARQGRARDWPYVMGIFQRMKHHEGGAALMNPDDEDAPPPRPMTMEEARAARLARSLAFEIPPEPDYAAISAQVERERLEHERQRAEERAKRQAAPPPAPAPPSFQLRAAVVQQGLFAPSAYEAKPQKKKKPAPPVDTRQRDMFGLPIDDDKPRENPDDLMQRIAARRQAERARREAQLESMHETMAADPGFQQAVRRRQAEETMQRYAAGPQLFKRGDRVVYAGADGAIPASWRGRVIGYEWHPEWDEDGDGHFNIVRWTTPEFETHEGVYHQSDLYRA